MSHEPFWALDTTGTWHLYSHVGVAYCGYKTDGAMVNGPRPEPPEVSPVVTAPDGMVLSEELVCEICRRGAPQAQLRQCESCGFECECEETDICVGFRDYQRKWVCKLCAGTPSPSNSDYSDLKRIICYIGNTLLAELRRLGLEPRGPYR
jgi:hypothetical protein